MSDPSRYRGLTTQISEERGRLRRVREDYVSITRSRFHALRMLWFSLKQLLGIVSPNDAYAVWSSGFSPSVREIRGPAPKIAVTLPEAESALVDAWNRRVAARRMPANPLVTIVIPAYNHREVTVRCLQSIADSWFESLDVGFIVVDDGSSDGTAELVSRLDGVDVLRSGTNQGFVAACNRAARLATGKYLCFLNNDTVVKEAWLDYLVVTAERDDAIGVVGSKLVYPDGRLQEAGAIVWRDATGWNVGRNESADDPRYNYVRDVDYVSGAAMLVRRELFERLGGFCDAYRPAYYEDADLCFGARSLGYRVVYQPRSVVVHDEGTSSSGESGAKRFQEINRPKFLERWSHELASHYDNDSANVAAASRPVQARKPVVLFVDSYVPLYDKEAGSQRMMHVVELVREMGYDVVFLPDNFAPLQPYTGELQQMGVEVLHHTDGGRTLNEALALALPRVDFAWISRPDLYHKYEPLIRRNRSVRVIYDTVDLSHVRERRKAELHGEDEAEWRRLLQLELDAARRADATVVVTPDEQRVLEELGISSVSVVPTIHERLAVHSPQFEKTAGLLFIGNYNHPPNVDAVAWLCQSVMPIVWRSLPEVALTIVGSNVNATVAALARDRVRVAGHVRDPGPLFRESRLFVAPLRFGAGMKGKIGHALAYELPIVTTPIGAEGLNLVDGKNASIADADPEAFAAAIVALYGDRDRWTALSRASAETLRPFTPEAVRRQLESLFSRLEQLQPA